jgi:hypothetical protein
LTVGLEQYLLDIEHNRNIVVSKMSYFIFLVFLSFLYFHRSGTNLQVSLSSSLPSAASEPVGGG